MSFFLACRAFFAVLFGTRLPQKLIESGLSSEPKHEPTSSKATDNASRATLPKPEAVAAQVLGLFQNEGRLVDFLLEDISEFSDEEVGQVVREIHKGCNKVLHDHFTLKPVREEPEESSITVEQDFDPNQIRLVGNVIGKPPYTGILKHPGYQAFEVRLPNQKTEPTMLIIAAAEVELP